MEAETTSVKMRRVESWVKFTAVLAAWTVVCTVIFAVWLLWHKTIMVEEFRDGTEPDLLISQGVDNSEANNTLTSPRPV